MRKLALLALLSVSIFADFFPNTLSTTVSKVNTNGITLQKAFPVNGMSGIVVHKYGTEDQAITSYIAQTDNAGYAKKIDKDMIPHEALPTINTPIKAGDKVIGGYLYNNVLLLAPDAATYAKITGAYNKNWIHPDLFALYLSTQGEEGPNSENLASFAQKYQVGLIMVVKNGKAVLIDPLSGKHISQMSLNTLPSKGQYPFFSRFEAISSGWFGSKNNKGNYYQTMEKL